MAVSVENILVEIYSITGVLVSSFYNNTFSADDLIIKCTEERDGGLNDFSFTVPSTTTEPLFGQMECRIYANGVWWYSGYAESIPSPDQDDPIIEITGLGFFHKLKEKTINESYTTQTLEFIVKDIASTYLGSDLDVYYDVSKIDVPVISNISIEFKGKTLKSAFESLSKIANKDYQTQQYTYGVDKEKELYFSAISNNTVTHYFEGYDYQEPEVETIDGKLINKILTYRTTLADPNVVEFVASYEDSESIGLNGLYEKSLTFPDFADSTTMSNIANSILERYSTPIERLAIKELEVSNILPIGFYELSNRRDQYIISVNEMEDLSQWDTSAMINTIPAIVSDNVFTGRKSLKLVTTVGSSGEFMEYILPVPIKFPDLFRLFVYLDDANADITIKLFDSNNNEFDIDFDSLSGIDQWLKKFANITSVLETANLVVDNGTGDEDLIVDVSPSLSGNMIVDKLVGAGVLDIVKVRIIINNNNASVLWIDSMTTRANTYFHRKLLLEQVEYELNKSFIANVTFGEKADSLIDEINDKVEDGDIALSVFSKQ